MASGALDPNVSRHYIQGTTRKSAESKYFGQLFKSEEVSSAYARCQVVRNVVRGGIRAVQSYTVPSYVP